MPKIIINPKLKRRMEIKYVSRKRNPRAMPDIHLIIIISPKRLSLVENLFNADLKLDNLKSGHSNFEIQLRI